MFDPESGRITFEGSRRVPMGRYDVVHGHEVCEKHGCRRVKHSRKPCERASNECRITTWTPRTVHRIRGSLVWITRTDRTELQCEFYVRNGERSVAPVINLGDVETVDPRHAAAIDGRAFMDFDWERKNPFRNEIFFFFYPLPSRKTRHAGLAPPPRTRCRLITRRVHYSFITFIHLLLFVDFNYDHSDVVYRLLRTKNTALAILRNRFETRCDF